MVRAVALRDDIFPSGRPADGYVVRTQWVGTWESQLTGIGRMTKFLSERLPKETFGFDDVALNVVFLQRHRVEVGLKLLLERTGSDVLNTHKLGLLMDRVKSAMASKSSPAWVNFVTTQQEYVDLLDEVDPGAATFRYPVDTAQQPWRREKQIDLAAFEKAGSAFHEAVEAVLESLAAGEPLPVDAADAKDAAAELRALSAACRRLSEISAHFHNHLIRQMQSLGTTPGSTYEANRRLLISVAQAGDEVAARADRMRQRVETTYGFNTQPAAAPPALPALPQLVLTIDPRKNQESLMEMMRLLATTTAEALRQLKPAMDFIEARMINWTTPYAAQLRAEVSRLRSRTGFA